MKQKDILSTFKTITTVYEIGNLHEYDTVMITGGEPLLDWKKLKSVMYDITRIVPRNTNIYLYTNGLKLQEEDFEWTLKKWFNGLNVGLHDPTAWDYKSILSHVHKILPVRVLIREDLVKSGFVKWSKDTGIPYRAWKINDCYVEEDRFLIRK
jgi:molybdenum cofactor biosynthesis enzyme MoaA